ATVNTKTTAGLVFDYYSPTDFKFAALVAGSNQVLIGHRTSSGWVTEAVATRTITAGTDYTLLVALEALTATVSLSSASLGSFTFSGTVNAGGLRLSTRSRAGSFDSLLTSGDDPACATGGFFLTAQAAPTSPVGEAGVLTADQLQPIFVAAIQRWTASLAGVSGLEVVTVRVEDLPGLALGEAVGHTIFIDPA